VSLKILIADDEPEILEIMAKKIFTQGYTVITAFDGEDAWQKIQRESPDIIVLDLNMPRKNGFEVLQELREHPRPKKNGSRLLSSPRERNWKMLKKGFPWKLITIF